MSRGATQPRPIDPDVRPTVAWLEIAEDVGVLARTHGVDAALESLRGALSAEAVILRAQDGEFETRSVVHGKSEIAQRRHLVGTLRPAPTHSSPDATPVDLVELDPDLRERWRRWGIQSQIVVETTQDLPPAVRLEICLARRLTLDSEAGFALRTIGRELAAELAVDTLRGRLAVAQAFIGSLEEAGPTLVHVYVPSRGCTLFANGRCQEFFRNVDLRPLSDRPIEHNRHPWLANVDPRDRARLQRQLQRTELLGAGEIIDDTYRFVIVGERRHLHVWSTRIAPYEPGSDEIMVTALDITRERELERHVEDLASRERREIGRDLHDGLCQDLIGLKIALDRRRKLSRDDPQALAQTMASVSESMSECLRQARAIAQGLNPMQISSHDLPAAMFDLAETTETRFGVRTTVHVHGSFGGLADVEAIQLYWIAREGVLNAARHAHASHIRIELRAGDRMIHLTVSDDGCGFDRAHPPGAGMGTRILERRARMIDADLRIESTPGGGTRLLCDFGTDRRDHEEGRVS